MLFNLRDDYVVENGTQLIFLYSLGKTFSMTCPGEQVRTKVATKSAGTCKRKRKLNYKHKRTELYISQLYNLHLSSNICVFSPICNLKKCE